MPVGRRCKFGCATWPDADQYKLCPMCQEQTTRYSNVEPMSRTEAAHAAFELFYTVWDDASKPERLAPDAPNAAGRFAGPKALLGTGAEPPRTHRLSPSG